MEFAVCILLVGVSLVLPLLFLIICYIYCCQRDINPIDIELGEVPEFNPVPFPERCIRRHLLPDCTRDEDAIEYSRNRNERNVSINHVFRASPSDFEVSIKMEGI